MGDGWWMDGGWWMDYGWKEKRVSISPFGRLNASSSHLISSHLLSPSIPLFPLLSPIIISPILFLKTREITMDDNHKNNGTLTEYPRSILYVHA